MSVRLVSRETEEEEMKEKEHGRTCQDKIVRTDLSRSESCACAIVFASVNLANWTRARVMSSKFDELEPTAWRQQAEREGVKSTSNRQQASCCLCPDTQVAQHTFQDSRLPLQVASI